MRKDKKKKRGKKVDNFLYEELSYKVRGCAFEVYNRLGFGYKESVYQKAFAEELKEKGIPFEREKRLGIRYREKNIGSYQPDFLIDDKIIIELKAVKYMPKSHERQIIHYIKSTGYKLGFLINFGSKKLDIRRRVWSLDYQRESAINQCKSVLALMAATALIFVFGVTVNDAHAAPGQVGLEVSPLSVEKEVERGEEFSFAVKFSNPLDEVQYIRPKFKDIRVYASGEITFLNYSSPRYTVSRWATFPKEPIELAPGEAKTLPVTVRVPRDAIIGEHFGGVFGEARAKSEKDNNGPYAVKQRVAPGCLVLVSVLGEDVLGASNEWEGDLHFSLEGKKLGGLYITSNPIQFNATFSNRGIYHQNVWGGIFIKNSFWGDQHSIRLEEKKALPELHVSYSKSFIPKRLLGRYNAQITVVYGRNGDKELERGESFWVLNPYLFITIPLLPLIYILWVRYRKKSTEDN